jgi:hypothetical protein
VAIKIAKISTTMLKRILVRRYPDEDLFEFEIID